MFKIFKRGFVFCLLLIFSYKSYQIYYNVKRVMTYSGLVKEVLTERHAVANEELVLAMIFTETKGKSRDVMQSSESAGNQANTITDDRESIRQGIQILSDNLIYANEKNVDVWTAVQAYNFGKGYIDYVSKNGGKNTIELATSYSRDVVAPSLGNKEGKTYFYLHPFSVLNGARLYKNGGNIYYSRQVYMNVHIMRIVNQYL